MPRGRYKRKPVAAAAGRAPKKNCPGLSDDKEFEDSSDAEYQYDEEEVEDMDEFEATEEEQAECETLIRQAFDRIGMDVDPYLVCFNACVEKAIDTRMIHSTSLSNWGGYKDFSVKLICVAQLCKKTKKLHCPTAPAIVVAYVLFEIRKIFRQGRSLLCPLMQICKTFDCAASAIGNYEAHPDVILKFDEAFEQPSSWPPRSRRKLSEQPQFTNIALARRVDLHHEQLSLTLKGPEASGAVLESDQTYEHVQVTRTITRQEAQEALEEIIKPLRNFETPECSILQCLTLPRLKVLPVDDKRLALWWMKDTEPELFSEWRKETEEDLEEYQWTETVKRKIPETGFNGPATAVFKRMEERAKEDANSSNLEDLALLKKMFNNKATCGMDQVFYDKIDQWILRLEHKMDEQAAISAKALKQLEKLEKLDLVDGQVAEQTATIAKLQKKLEFVLAKQNETSEPMMEDTEPCHPGDNLIDFVDAKNTLSIDE
ncbi:hypothetical protein HDV63DRAFT_413511 [Trichoderma sp. SZMC 28014]